MIVITGATGLIGRAVAQALTNAKHSLRLQARNAQAANTLFGNLPDVELVCLNLDSAAPADYQKLVSGCNAVIHTAALVHRPDADRELYQRLNERPTRMLAEAAKRAGVESFVFLSTSAVYGSGPFDNCRETTPAKPDTLYGQSKLDCENILQEIAPAARTVILRPSLVFGEGDRGNMLSLIKQVSRRMYFHIGEAQTRKSLIYAGDIARVLPPLLERGELGCQILNVANPEAPTLHNIAESIAIAAGLPSQLPTLPPPVVGLAAAAASMVLGKRSPITPEKVTKLRCTTTLCVDRLIQAVDFKPSHTLVEALSKEIAWARANSLI